MPSHLTITGHLTHDVTYLTETKDNRPMATPLMKLKMADNIYINRENPKFPVYYTLDYWGKVDDNRLGFLRTGTYIIAQASLKPNPGYDGISTMGNQSLKLSGKLTDWELGLPTLNRRDNASKEDKDKVSLLVYTIVAQQKHLPYANSSMPLVMKTTNTQLRLLPAQLK